MQPTLEAIAASPWFALVSGIASLLGCLLAVYPVQVSGIEPSVYRGLIWEKTLLWSTGLAIIVSSIVEIHGQQAPNPNSPVGRIYNSITEGMDRIEPIQYGPVNTGPVPISSSPPGIVRGHGDGGIISGGSGGLGSGTQSGAGRISSTQSTGNTKSGTTDAGTGTSGIVEAPGGAIGGGRNSGQAQYGSQLWYFTLVAGVVLIFVGYLKKPFATTLARLKLLEEELATRREEFLARLKGSSEASTATTMEIYDRNADLTRAALFFMLTGYRLQPSTAGGSYLMPSDLRMIAALMKAENKSVQSEGA